MCEPITIGVLTAASGTMSAIGQHQAQQAAVARQNQIQQQQYQNQLRITEERDRAKKEKHAADLQAHASAQTDLLKQQQFNQMEADRASQATARQLKEKKTEAAFEAQANMASAIQAQGQILSTGGTGQSFLLQTLESERALGMQGAMIEQSLYDANAAYGNEILGINMRLYSANAEAQNNLPPVPRAPGASMIPYKPIKAKGPSKLALMGNIGGAVMGGVSAGYSANSAINGVKIKPS